MPHFRTLSEISYELAQRIPPLYKDGPIFFVAPDEKEARQLLELCQYWNSDFPEDVIISTHFQKEYRLSEAEYKKQTLQLTVQQDTETQSALIEKLARLGFERFPRAVAPHSFAVRGNIIDIIDRKAMRVEFEDNTITKLSYFNPSTQHSGADISNLTIFPRAYAEHIPTWHEHDLEYEFVTPKFYHKRFQLLKQDAKKFLHTIVATDHPAKVKAILPLADLRAAQRGLEGFIVPQEHLLFLNDEHIFGREAKINSFDTNLDINDIDPGDYVVHIDHGIALFNGIITIDKEDYFELHYANKDKLYIPLAQANRIDKYVGTEQPTLTRLSGAQWETIVHKVEEDVLTTAQELLKMYANRETAQAKSIPLERPSDEQRIAQAVDFELTPDQLQAIEDGLNDLTQTKPMNRLVCGDVGFGKTEVALQLAVHVVQHGGQVAILAPTTILAQQHFQTFSERLAPYGIEVAVLSRLHNTKNQTIIVDQLNKKQIDIIIGTHRLLSSDVTIPNLELIVIDEEQRFGVRHKERFKALRSTAHVLTMTATPIPRTLNLALSGLQEISVLNTAPAERQAIHTVIEQYSADREYNAISEELERHGQVYIVHNNLSTIYSVERLLHKRFPEQHIAIAHGKMEAKPLIRIMRDFHAGSIDILIASTIIENGLDIANANTLIVEHAEQFGLAQLYQLRGRIGRSARQAYAYLLYTAEKLTPQAKRRLKALHSIKELGGGFELAMKDLEIRGVGDILGKKQHGHVEHIGLNLYLRLLQHAIEKLK